jgi:hypothetical protein
VCAFPDRSSSVNPVSSNDVSPMPRTCRGTSKAYF